VFPTFRKSNAETEFPGLGVAAYRFKPTSRRNHAASRADVLRPFRARRSPHLSAPLLDGSGNLWVPHPFPRFLRKRVGRRSPYSVAGSIERPVLQRAEPQAVDMVEMWTIPWKTPRLWRIVPWRKGEFQVY
jgi:hypothetical protein